MREDTTTGECAAQDPRPEASLHLWQYFGYRSQVWLYRLLSRLRSHPAHLLLRDEWTDGAQPAEFPWPAERLHILPGRSALSRLMGKLGPALRTGRWSGLNSFDAAHIRALSNRLPARVVHVHFGWLACRLLHTRPDLGAPLVVSLYGSDVFRAQGAYRRSLCTLLRRDDITFVTTSEGLKQGAVELGAAPDRVHVIPVGIDTTALPAANAVRERRKPRVTEAPLRLITVGRMIACKAPQDLPRIARALQDAGVPFEWIVVGDGPLMEDFRKSAERLGVRDRFVVKGSIPSADVQALLWESDLMVHNAVVAESGEREALGVVLMEAGAAGLPAVSCPIGGIPEIVRDGEGGVLVESGRPEAMAAAVADLAVRPEVRTAMGLAAMERVRRLFDSESLALRLEELYDHLPPRP